VARAPGDKCALPEARTLAAEMRPEEILPPASEAPDSAETETPVDPEVSELPELDDAEGEVIERAEQPVEAEMATTAPDAPPSTLVTGPLSVARASARAPGLPLKGGGNKEDRLIARKEGGDEPAPEPPPLPPIVARAPNPKSLTGGYRRREDQFKFRAAMQEMIGRRWNGDDKLTCVGKRAADSARS
jgi:hypothetical protein